MRPVSAKRAPSLRLLGRCVHATLDTNLFTLPLLLQPQRYSGLLYIVVAIVALVCVVYAFLAALVCFIGGTITGGLFRMSNLALWALTCAQVCDRNPVMLHDMTGATLVNVFARSYPTPLMWSRHLCRRSSHDYTTLSPYCSFRAFSFRPRALARSRLRQSF